MGKRITSEHYENHDFRTQPFFITSKHHVNHHFRTQPKNRALWLLTGLWEVTRSITKQRHHLGFVSLYNALNCTGSYYPLASGVLTLNKPFRVYLGGVMLMNDVDVDDADRVVVADVDDACDVDST